MSFYSEFKQVLVGKSLPTSAHAEERLTNAAALAVLSSDALSSLAYGTEEILLVLVGAGSLTLGWSIPIAIAIILLLSIVIFSYRQTIRADPFGRGFVDRRLYLNRHGERFCRNRGENFSKTRIATLNDRALLGFYTFDRGCKFAEIPRISPNFYDAKLSVNW